MIKAELPGAGWVSITDAQAELLAKARAAGGIFVRRGAVRSARALADLGFGVLEDNGVCVSGDGERWFFQVKR